MDDDPIVVATIASAPLRRLHVASATLIGILRQASGVRQQCIISATIRNPAGNQFFSRAGWGHRISIFSIFEIKLRTSHFVP